MKVFKSYEWVYVNKYFDDWKKGWGEGHICEHLKLAASLPSFTD
jgi:hypothetical protein